MLGRLIIVNLEKPPLIFILIKDKTDFPISHGLFITDATAIKARTEISDFLQVMPKGN